MKRTLPALVEYLEKLTGSPVDLAPAEPRSLPLFLRERFQLHQGEVFGRSFIFAIDTWGEEDPSAANYANLTENLSGHLGDSVVLVLPGLAQHIRQGLIRLGRPFIVPGSQTFLPTAIIDLRERQPTALPAAKTLSPAAQCVLLYHLERQSIHPWSLQKVAEAVGYSPNMLVKVKRELEAAELCDPVRDGRVVTLRFHVERRALWQQALPWMASPVRATHWVHWEKPPAEAIMAGMTALSRATMIVDDRTPVYALHHKVFKDNAFKICADRIDATARLEIWNYNPRLLTIREEMVDPLSLFLSLRHDPNERVQDQLETLIERFPW
jgi:hypothetical protein